jgi:hypothetical protein
VGLGCGILFNCRNPDLARETLAIIRNIPPVGRSRGSFMNTSCPAFRTAPAFAAWMAFGCLLAVAGCQSDRPRPMSPNLPPPPEFVDAPRACTASRMHFALGKRITAPLLDEMRMRSGAFMARTVLPDDAPMGFVAGRLLVDVEVTGRVVSVRCA